ncbi:MAG: hypothetical protein ABIS45_01100 [Burkholderiales bacterium]
MKHAVPTQSSFAMLFDPELARAVTARAAQWDLPRHMCRPLDREGPRVTAGLAADDEALELAPQTDEPLREDATDDAAAGADAEDTDDL